MPQAVVFHAEAAHRGLRRTPLTGRHTHYQERRAALFTLLANSRSRVWPLQAVRLAFGTFVRMFGYLAIRSPGAGARRPRGVHLGGGAPAVSCWRPGGPVAPRPPPTPRRPSGCWRRAGCPTGTVSTPSATWRPRSPSPPPTWPSGAARRLPSATRRRSRRGARRSGSGSRTTRWSRTPGWSPASSPTRSPCCSPSPCSRCSSAPAPRSATSPGRGSRRRRTTGATGGRCTSRRGTSSGSAPRCPAPPYVLPMALLATVLGGSPAAAVSALLVLAVPFALWGAWRFLRVAGRLATPAGANRWLILWGATTYAAGAGRLRRVGPGPARPWCSSAALLPWLAHAALGFADPESDRRWRAAWRTGLLLALVSCGTPVAWLVAALVGARRGAARVHAAARRRPGPVGLGSAGRRAGRGPGAARAVVAPGAAARRRRGAAARRRAAAGARPRTGSSWALGRLHDLGAPWWLGVVLPVLAALALVPAPDPDPGAHLLGGRAASRSSRPSGSGRSRSTWPRCPPRPASASSWSSCRRRW